MAKFWIVASAVSVLGGCAFDRLPWDREPSPTEQDAPTAIAFNVPSTPVSAAAPSSTAAVDAVPSAPAASPVVAPSASETMRIIIGGDLLPHRPSLVAPESIRTALAPLSPLFGKADAVVANFEAATGEADKKTQRLAYAAPRGWLDELPKAGIRAVTVANNHACDLGEAGLQATLESASSSGLVAIGGDANDPWAPRVLAERGGKRVCAVAWTTIMNSEGACAHSKSLAVASLGASGKARIDRAMARARAECDATIAIFHGGEEYVPQTTLVLDQAARAAESGADAVVIHHPHVASPVVVHATKDGRKVPIFASVGNLVSNQGESYKPSMFPVLPDNRRLVCVNAWTRLGVLADLSFDVSERSVRLDWSYHLVWAENSHADDRKAPAKIETRLLEPEQDRALVDKLRQDRVGPLALFSDACWTEGREGAAKAGTDDAPVSPSHDERCSSTIVRTPRPSGDGVGVALRPGTPGLETVSALSVASAKGAAHGHKHAARRRK